MLLRVVRASNPSLPEINLDLVPAEIRSSVSALLELVRCLLSENRLLRDRLDLLVRRYFGGQKNERISSEQLELMLQGFTRELMATQTSVAREPASKDTPATRSKPVRQGLPDHLPVRSTQTLVPPDGQAEPELEDSRLQVIDPHTAYQMTSILEGVAVRGTAAALRPIGTNSAGQTGTTNDAKDTWFNGYSPDMVVGAVLG